MPRRRWAESRRPASPALKPRGLAGLATLAREVGVAVAALGSPPAGTEVASAVTWAYAGAAGLTLREAAYTLPRKHLALRAVLRLDGSEPRD